MPRYVGANGLQDVRDYLDGIFDTQLFRSLCVNIARFLPSRYVPDKRTMQANRDRFERKQLLQVFGEPDYDSPLLSASKTEQKRNASPVTTKDRSDKKRVKSVKTTSSISKSKTIPQHNKQCKRPGCVSRGTSPTHTHAQCFYKTDNAKGFSPTTNLLAKKEKTPPYTKPNPSGPPTRATSGPTLEAFKPSPGSSSAKPRKEPSEVDCGKKGQYSGDCPSNTKRKSLHSKNKPFRSLLAKQAFAPAQTQAAIRIRDTYNQSVCHNCLVHGCRGHNCDVMAGLNESPYLTFNTYFLLDANIDHNEDDAQQARQRHHNINSYFSDEEDGQSSPSGGEKADDEARDDEEYGSNEDKTSSGYLLPAFFLGL
jgi:hypothetical protein